MEGRLLRCMFKPACARQWDFAEESDLKLGDLERDGGAFPAFPDGREIRLRIKKTKNGQENGIHWAKDYEL